jgi:hypothetical protein
LLANIRLGRKWEAVTKAQAVLVTTVKVK